MAPKRALPPSRMRSQPLSSLSVLQAQLHVLRHLLSSLMNTRGLYPPATFERVALYAVEGYASRMPAVKNYLNRAIEALEEALEKGGGGRVLLVFMDGDEPQTSRERWVFDIPALVPIHDHQSVSSILLSAEACRTLLTSCALAWSRFENAPTPDDLPALLAPLMEKTIQASLSLSDLNLSDASTFTIILEFPQTTKVPPAGKEGDWLPPLRTAPVSVAKGVKWVGVSETGMVDVRLPVSFRCSSQELTR